MATIQLTDVLFYKGGSSGGISAVVGNGWENGGVVSRVARYTFTAPEVGANRVRLTFHITGVAGGENIPVRFFIGTNPASHADAGPESPYTGELTLAEGWLIMTGEAEVLLLPGKTYYLWVFPGSEDYGCYTWTRAGYTSAMETEGAAFVLPVTVGGAWRKIMLHVVKVGKFFLIAPCVVRGGKWYYLSAPE